MKTSEAKKLQHGDTVFIFIGMTKWEVIVEKVEQLSFRLFQIGVMWLAKGTVQHARRIHTSTYLTPQTGARLKSINRLKPVRETENSILEPSAVPAEIVRCAIRIENWMKANNHRRWKFMGIQSRDIA